MDFVFSISKLNKSSKDCLCVVNWRITVISDKASYQPADRTESLP